MKRLRSRRQLGVALIALLAVLAIGASAFLIRQLNVESGGMDAIRKNRNAEVLNRAKQTLIGYVAMTAANAGESNPGRLPCPEHAWYIGIPDKEGIMGPSVGVPNPGFGSTDCASIGRLPWRSMGLDKLVDATGEPLWYVVSPGWALSNSTTPALTTYINSNSTGQLLVNARSVSALSQTAGLATAVSTAHGFRTGDIVKIAGAILAGYNVAASVTVINPNTFTYSVNSALSSPATGSIRAGDAAVALIIAPGPAMNVAASADCAARSQARSAPAPTINALDYLECYDATYGVFSMTGPAASFNNQVVRITVADIMPAIEAAIAHRIEREIVPVLNAVYAPPAPPAVCPPSNWGFCGTKPVFPFAAPFTSPGPGTGTSNFLGVAGTYQGLLPFNQTQGCTADPANPRCLPSLITWTPANAYVNGVYGYLQTQTCSWESTYVRLCEGEYHEDVAQPSQPIRIEMQMTFNNVAMGLRKLDPAWLASVTTNMEVQARDDVALGAWQPQTVSYTVTMNDGSVVGKPAGSATITFGATLPNIDDMVWGTYAQFRIRFRSVNSAMGDHALLDSTDTTTGWFVRNEWYRLVYYAVAQGHSAATLPPTCTSGTNCLSVINLAPAGAQRAILILAGRNIVSGATRPSGTLTNYLEFGNATGAFESQPVNDSVAAGPKKPFNDRIVVIGSN